tara:strand:- start:129 stop:902 length:774 start_codon:yes stop_codon:yes gene_type:complete
MFSPKRDRGTVRYASCCKRCAADWRKDRDATPEGKEAKRQRNTSVAAKAEKRTYATSDKGKATIAAYLVAHPNLMPAAQKKYFQNKKGRLNQHRANTSTKGRERSRRFDKTDKGRAIKKRQYEAQMASPTKRLKKNIAQSVSKSIHDLSHPSRGVAWTGLLTGRALMDYLKSTFTPGMDEGNHGAGGWDVDHIIPKSLYNHGDEEDVRRCWNYRNLRACWHLRNLQKTNHVVSALVAQVPVELWPKAWNGVIPTTLY